MKNVTLEKKAAALLLLLLFLPSCGPRGRDTVLLKNGGVIQGTVVVDESDRVVVRWKGGEVEFQRHEVAEIRYGERLVKGKTGVEIPDFKAEVGPGGPVTYPRIVLTNGQAISGQEIRKEGESFHAKQVLSGGGSIEQVFPIEKIDRIELGPAPSGEELGKDFDKLRKDYPKMSRFTKEPYYVLSDSESSDLVQYFRTLQRLDDDFLIHFFEWLDVSVKPKPLPVVIFADYKEFAAKGGFPANSNVVGFYLPDNGILFLFNVKETDLVKRMFAWTGALGGTLKEFFEAVETGPSIDPAQRSRVLGYKDFVMQDVERMQNKLESEAREDTVSTIRHEGGHQLLHLFGIDSDKVYRGAWFSEGLACYLEPEVPGDVNTDRLMALRYDLEKAKLMPLQYLLSFQSAGGIHRLPPDYALLGYEQSWAFIYFLMTGRYHDAFGNYVRELMQQGKDFDSEKDIALLEKHMAHSLREIEIEFKAFLDQLMKEKIDPEEYDDYQFLRVMSGR